VPAPARYAVHKLIIATRRAQTAAAKARKDVEQAIALIRALAEDQPDELARAYQEAGSRGEQWRRALNHGTNRITGEVRQMLDRLLAQSAATDGLRRPARRAALRLHVLRWPASAAASRGKGPGQHTYAANAITRSAKCRSRTKGGERDGP
jgi:hypothetical protein